MGLNFNEKVNKRIDSFIHVDRDVQPACDASKSWKQTDLDQLDVNQQIMNGKIRPPEEQFPGYEDGVELRDKLVCADTQVHDVDSNGVKHLSFHEKVEKKLSEKKNPNAGKTAKDNTFIIDIIPEKVSSHRGMKVVVIGPDKGKFHAEVFNSYGSKVFTTPISIESGKAETDAWRFIDKLIEDKYKKK